MAQSILSRIGSIGRQQWSGSKSISRLQTRSYRNGDLFLMARKARKGEQLITGNAGKIKDVGGDRLRSGVVNAGHLASGGTSSPGSPPSVFDVFITKGDEQK